MGAAPKRSKAGEEGSAFPIMAINTHCTVAVSGFSVLPPHLPLLWAGPPLSCRLASLRLCSPCQVLLVTMTEYVMWKLAWAHGLEGSVLGWDVGCEEQLSVEGREAEGRRLALSSFPFPHLVLPSQWDDT